MEKPIKRVAVTGAAGQIAYALLFRIAHGDLLGYDQPISLHLLELSSMSQALEGIRMELEDCAFPLLKEIFVGSDPTTIFKDIDYAILVGSKPRTPGMERSELLNDNAKIFIEQGQVLDQIASKNALVFVVGNPCNTNCLLAMKQASSIPKRNFFAMTRLDQNRATSFLARKAGVYATEVSNVTIWGNHSTTQVPDFIHTKIQGKPCEQVIHDRNWLEKEFVSAVQKRGAVILAARGKSSAASAANAVIDSFRSLLLPTPSGNWFSIAVCSDGNPYGIGEGLIFSFPCRSKGNADWEIVPDLSWDPFLESKIRESEKELFEEKSLIGL